MHNLAVKIPSGDIEQYSTQLDVPNSEVDDTSWVVLHWSNVSTWIVLRPCCAGEGGPATYDVTIDA